MGYQTSPPVALWQFLSGSFPRQLGPGQFLSGARNGGGRAGQGRHRYGGGIVADEQGERGKGERSAGAAGIFKHCFERLEHRGRGFRGANAHAHWDFMMVNAKLL